MYGVPLYSERPPYIIPRPATVTKGATTTTAAHYKHNNILCIFIHTDTHASRARTRFIWPVKLQTITCVHTQHTTTTLLYSIFRVRQCLVSVYIRECFRFQLLFHVRALARIYSDCTTRGCWDSTHTQIHVWVCKCVCVCVCVCVCTYKYELAGGRVVLFTYLSRAH